MTRQPNKASTSAAAAKAAPEKAGSLAATAPSALPGGIDTARSVITNSLATACGMLNWMTQLQRLQAKGIAEWGQTLETAMHDSEGAADPLALMNVTANLVHAQMALTFRQLGAGFAQWVESEMQFAERMGGEVAAMTQQALPGSVHPVTANGGELVTLKEIGRMQDQWLAMTQRWLDSAGARTAH